MEASTMERRAAPTADLLSKLDPAEFKGWIQTKQAAAQEIVNCISEQVDQQRLSSFEGGAVVAALYGSVFGYRQFHGEAAPSDIVQTLSETLRPGNSR